MINRSSAPTVLTIGLVLAVIAVLGATVEVAALDRSAVEADSARLLRTGQVEASLRPRAAAVLADVTPAGTTLGDPDTAADRMLHDPAFARAFSGALGDVSRHVFDGDAQPIELDPMLVHAAAASTISALDPSAAGLSLGGPGPTVALDPETIPHLGGVASSVRLVGTISAIIGLILIVAGILLSERRIRAVGRVGRWTAGTGVVLLVGFWLLPRFAAPIVGGWTEVAGVVTASGDAFLLPAVALIGVGTAIAFAANRLVALGREHTLSVVPKAPMRRATASERTWRDSA